MILFDRKVGWGLSSGNSGNHTCNHGNYLITPETSHSWRSVPLAPMTHNVTIVTGTCDYSVAPPAQGEEPKQFPLEMPNKLVDQM